NALALSNSKLTYNTLPFVQLKPIHFFPSAIAIDRPINANDLPALEGPAINILCPCRNTPSINGGAKSGISSQKSVELSGSGKSSLISSIHSSQSSQLLLPMFVSIMNCFLPFLSMPGILLNRDGFLFWLSISNPFLRQTSYKQSTRLRYSS